LGQKGRDSQTGWFSQQPPCVRGQVEGLGCCWVTFFSSVASTRWLWGPLGEIFGNFLLLFFLKKNNNNNDKKK
jgi:hypothetical protein